MAERMGAACGYANATDTAGWGQETDDTASHGYPMGRGLLKRFDEHVFETGDPQIGAMDYYLYDPVKHGAAERRYPLLLMLHGAYNGGPKDKLCGALTDWMIFAGDAYQQLLGGAYIAFPKANEYHTAQRLERNGAYYVYQPAGTWLTKKNGISSYSPALAALVRSLCQRHRIETVGVIGTSAGGYMAWRLAIDYPTLFRCVVPVAPAYTPDASELKRVDESGIAVWVIHGEQDVNCPIVQYTGPAIPTLEKMQNARVTVLDTVRFGNGKTVRIISGGKDIGQHLAQFAVGQNLRYDNGTPYDVRYPETLTDWLKREFAMRC